jgi:bifunctional DNase/RNase
VTDPDPVEVELLGVRVELPSNTPIVLLRERSGRRNVSIFIGGPEATAIAFALEGVETPRPLTHDLMCDVLAELDVRLVRVVVTELRDTTFYAELHLEANGGERIVSARPSDAIALAARVSCPIFARRELIDAVGFVEEVIEEDEVLVDDPDDVVEEFRAFIDNVNPDDFAS